MATTADARTRARRIVEEALAAAGVAASPATGGDPSPGPDREAERALDPPEAQEAVVAQASPGDGAANGQVDGDRAQAAALARRIVAEVMAEEQARAEAAEAAAAEKAAARAAALARAAEEADAAADAAAAEAVARAAEGIPVPEPVPAPDPLPRPDPFPDPSPEPDPSPDPFPPDPSPDPLPPDPFPPEPEPEPVSEGGPGSTVPAAVPVASVDLFPTVTQPTDVGHEEPTIVAGDEPTVVADGQPSPAPDEVTQELPAGPTAPPGPPPLPLEVVSGWWRKRRAVRQRQRAMAEWAPDARQRPRRTGRWLIATIVMVLAIALLFPMAVDALRQLVAL